MTIDPAQLGQILLFAIVRSGMNKLHVIGMAVVESESNDSWDWFLRFVQFVPLAPTFADANDYSKCL